jgi:hypothetical protein
VEEGVGVALTAGTGGAVRVRKILVSAQVALSFLLLFGAGLFVQSLQNLRDTKSGFQSIEHLLSFRLDPSLNGYTLQRAKRSALRSLAATRCEARALLRAKLAQPGIRNEAVGELLQLQFTTGRDTIYPGIKRVLPGETLIVRRGAGALPGYLMKRGTIVLGEGASALSPTFVDCGTHRLLAMRLIAAFIKPYSARMAVLLGGALRRYAGDMAVLGKGELFTGNQS